MHETDELLTEVQELTWALVDEQATQQEVCRLERLLLDRDEARRIYVMCMQMHADLHFLFNPPPQLPTSLRQVVKAEKAKRSKLPLPLVDLPSIDSQAPFADGCK